MTKDKLVIPRGPYCYDDDGVCPYWSIKDELPNQYNGYCAYLEQSDVDLCCDMELENMRTGEVERGCDVPFPVSLLWDQCKMCGINDDWDEEDE